MESRVGFPDPFVKDARGNPGRAGTSSVAPSASNNHTTGLLMTSVLISGSECTVTVHVEQPQASELPVKNCNDSAPEHAL